ncbi:MAG TPA: DNA polymerase III subunit delta [Firmicutes bacterium]|nr:DNA polymerase III subunit delta [Bacillota bacterium]HCF90005.1 DNA polymerase III subunit delta [Bacillota bacterium]HCM17498.1 DNA polymerase III subunit delta [Bacillota bacterium]HCT35474.1 DNA polymerase III subunit delta [Bacillota bacterium]
MSIANIGQFDNAVQKKKDTNQKNSLKGVYIFVGPELFSAAKSIAAAVQGLLSENIRDFNFVKLHGGDVDPETLSSFVSGPPFMSELRIAHLPAFEELPSKMEEGVLAALQNCAPSTLVFIEILKEKAQVDKRTKLGKWFDQSPNAQVIPCPALWPKEAASWVQQELRARGIKYENGVPQDLIRLLGTDQRTLAGEIEKLSLYMNPEDSYVSKTDCAQVCSSTLEDNSYALLDSVAARDLEGSLTLLRSLRLAGHPEQRFLYNLAQQFRRVYLAAFLREQGKKSAEIAKELDLKTQYYENIVQRYLKQAQAYNQDELRLALRRIRDGDAAVKAGLRAAKIETEMILFDLCTPGRLAKQQWTGCNKQ